MTDHRRETMEAQWQRINVALADLYARDRVREENERRLAAALAELGHEVELVELVRSEEPNDELLSQSREIIEAEASKIRRSDRIAAEAEAYRNWGAGPKPIAAPVIDAHADTRAVREALYKKFQRQ